jgi:hypothetical protein
MYAYIMCRIDPSYQHASWNVSTGPEHTLPDLAKGLHTLAYLFGSKKYTAYRLYTDSV